MYIYIRNTFIGLMLQSQRTNQDIDILSRYPKKLTMSNVGKELVILFIYFDI